MCSDKALAALLESLAAARCKIRMKVHKDSKVNTINWFSQESIHNLCRSSSNWSAFLVNLSSEFKFWTFIELSNNFLVLFELLKISIEKSKANSSRDTLTSVSLIRSSWE